MAYTPGFEIDVFISYSHANNEDGWVEGFRQFLVGRIPQFLPHAAKLQVWKDDRLNGFDELWPTLQYNIESSALFLSIASPTYVTSDNCAKEVEHFQSRSREVLRIDRQSRMARVAIIPTLDDESVLPPFRTNQTVYYKFFESYEDGTIGQFPTTSPSFRTQADRVAQHVASQLKRLHDAAQRSESLRAPSARKRLFLANASKDRDVARTTILNEFKDSEVLTIPDGQYTTNEITELTHKLLERASCSVHLLGENPGPSVDEGDVSISHLQYRLALGHRPGEFRQVVWAPNSLQLTHERQRNFVQSVRAFDLKVWDKSTELFDGTLDDLMRGMRGVLTREPAVSSVAGAGPLYLLCSKSDLEHGDENLMELRNWLLNAGVLPEFPAFDEQGVDLAELERTLIRESRGTLIYYGRGGDGWVKLKRQTLLSVLGEHQDKGKKIRAVYVGCPVNEQKRMQYMGIRSGLPEGRGFPPLLVLGDADIFQSTHLQPLLARMEELDG